MLEYSDEPKRLVSTFLTYRNDVDIYTEDEETDKEFYKVLFSRLIKPEIKINDVNIIEVDQKVRKAHGELKILEWDRANILGKFNVLRDHLSSRIDLLQKYRRRQKRSNAFKSRWL